MKNLYSYFIVYYLISKFIENNKLEQKVIDMIKYYTNYHKSIIKKYIIIISNNEKILSIKLKDSQKEFLSLILK